MALRDYEAPPSNYPIEDNLDTLAEHPYIDEDDLIKIVERAQKGEELNPSEQILIESAGFIRRTTN